MKKSFYMAFMSAILFSVFLFPALCASEENGEQEVYTLGEIVVSAMGTGVETIGTVREITAEDLEISSAETLDDALMLLPGIMVRTGGQGVPRPDLRGMKPRHVTLLIDGIPFNSAGDGQFDPRLITTENIAKIKISYGNDSVLYGPGGLGGVINVITKKGIKKTKLNVEGKWARKDDKLGKASLSDGNDFADYFISASVYKSDGYELSDDFSPTAYEDGGTRNNSDQQLTNLFGSLTFSPNDKTQVGLIINHIEGEYGIPSITLDKTDPFGKNPKYERVDDRKGLSLNLSGNYDIDGPLSFRGWVFSNDYDDTKNGYDDNTYTTQTKKGSYRALESTEIRGASFQTKYISDNYGTVSLALGTKDEGFDSEGWEVGKSSTTSFNESHEITTNTAALEYEIEPSEKTGFVAGYGYSWFEKENTSNDSTDNYLIGFNYDLSKRSRIKASVADKVRFPSVTQLYGIGEGNPNLTYEESMNYELGFEHRISNGRTFFSITAFKRDVENYIKKDEDDVNQNRNEYQFQGIEIMATNQSVKNLDLKLGYTYMDTKDKSPGTLLDEVEHNPEHRLSLEGAYNFANDFSVYAGISRVDDQYNHNSDNTLKVKLPDYTIVNLKIEKRFFSRALKVFAGAKNLFDENYFDSYALPREGRSVYLGFNYSMEQ